MEKSRKPQLIRKKPLKSSKIRNFSWPQRLNTPQEDSFPGENGQF
jgi:hypothetical protein